MAPIEHRGIGVSIRRDLQAIPAFVRPTVPEGMVRAGLNESPFPPIEGLAEALAAEVPHLNRYGGRAVEAINAIAAAHGCHPDQVVLGPGSSALIQAIVGTMCDPGHEVLFSCLTFDGYVSATLAWGAVPMMVPWAADGGHDVDALLAAVTEQTRIVIISTPNNPSGTILRSDQYERLIQGLPPRVLLVLDEAYSDFATSTDAFVGRGEERVPTNVSANVVVMKTLSKACGLAGLRAGYLLVDREVVMAVSALRPSTSVSRLAHAGIVYCFSSEGKRLIADRVAFLTSERDRIVRLLQSVDVPVPHSDGNFVWFPAGAQAAALHVALYEAGIMARLYPGYGVRYTVDEGTANDRFIQVSAAWWTPTDRDGDG